MRICAWLDPFDLLAQAVDMGLQRMRGDPGVIAPDLTQQRLAPDRALFGAVEIFEDRGFSFP